MNGQTDLEQKFPIDINLVRGLPKTKTLLEFKIEVVRVSGLKPDITDEEIGIRSFQLRKGRAVERAMEKIRQKMARVWSEISPQDIELLQWALGETWALMGQYEWDRIYFSNIDMPTTVGIIDVAKEILSHQKVGYQGFEEIHQTLKGLESKTAQPS